MIDLVHNKSLAFALALIMTSAAVAQRRIWTVGLPSGRDFSTLQGAVDAAQPGDIIAVELYQGMSDPVFIHKGLIVLPTQTIEFRARLTIANIPTNQTFILAYWGGYSDIDVYNCRGAVHIFGRAALSPSLLESSIAIQNCDLLTIESSHVVDVFVQNSTVRIANSRVDGLSFFPPVPHTTAFPAITMIDSDVVVTRGDVTASTAISDGRWPEVPAIDMIRGRLQLVGEVAVQGGVSQWTNPPRILFGPAIRSYGGSVVIDPASRLAWRSGLPLVGDSAVTLRATPALSPEFTGDASNVIVDVRVHAPAGASAAIFMNFRPTHPLPSPFGEFWLNPVVGSPLLVGSGSIDAMNLFSVRLMLSPALASGDFVLWQAVTADSNGIHLSNPTTFLHPLPFPFP